MNKVFNRLFKYAIPVLSFIGILLCIELCVIYYNANFVANSAPSFCHISTEIDCDAVARSAYSLFLGIPLSLYGLGFYCFVFFLSILPKKILPDAKSYIYTISIFSVIMSLTMWFISSFVIHKICLLCYAMYLVNFLIFLISKLGGSSMQHFKNTFNGVKALLSNKTYRILIMLAIIAGLLFYIVINWFHVFQPKVLYIDTDNGYKASIDTQYGNILGHKGAKLLIREYTDFQCPYCAMSDEMLHKLVKEEKDVEIIHYNFPMSNKCNKVIAGNMHEYSCTAALYSIASKKQNKMVQFNSLLFENQQNLSEPRILVLAKSINLDVEKLKRDAYSPSTERELKENIDMGISLGITGTPTYFIGVQKYDGYMPYPKMKAIVDNDLK